VYLPVVATGAAGAATTKARGGAPTLTAGLALGAAVASDASADPADGSGVSADANGAEETDAVSPGTFTLGREYTFA
jgi:hypothetical protein